MDLSSFNSNADEGNQYAEPGANAMPDSTEDPASSSIQSPDFELAADGSRDRAPSDGGSPDDDQFGHSPSSIPGFTFAPASASPKDSANAGDAPTDNSATDPAPLQRQPVKQIGQIPLMDDSWVFQRPGGPGVETPEQFQAQHDDWMRMAQRSRAQREQIAQINQSDPYISDEDGRWKKQSVDPKTGAIHESDILDTGSGKINRRNGDIYVQTAQGPQVIGTDPQQKLLAQIVDQKAQAQAQGSPTAANIAAAQSTLLHTQQQLQNFQGVPERMMAQIGTYTQASLDPDNIAAANQLQRAKAEFANWKQQNPRYSALSARRDALANQIQTQLAEKAQSDAQTAQFLTTPQYVQWNGNTPPAPDAIERDAAASNGSASAPDISIHDLDARAGIISAQTGFPAGLSYASALNEAKQNGSQSLDGDSINDAIQRIQPVAQSQLLKMTPPQLLEAVQSGLITRQQVQTTLAARDATQPQPTSVPNDTDQHPDATGLAQSVTDLTARAADLRNKIRTAFDTGGADGASNLAAYRADLADTENQLHAATQTLINQVPSELQARIVKVAAPSLDWDAAAQQNAQDPMVHFATENLGDALREPMLSPQQQFAIRKLASVNGANPDIADHIANQALGASAVKDFLTVLQGGAIAQGNAETLQNMGFLQQSDPTDPTSPLHLTEDAQRLLPPGWQRLAPLRPDLARYTPSPDPAHGSALYQNAIAGMDNFSDTAEKMLPQAPDADSAQGGTPSNGAATQPDLWPQQSTDAGTNKPAAIPSLRDQAASQANGNGPAGNTPPDANANTNSTESTAWTSGSGVFPERDDSNLQGSQPTPEQNLDLARQGKKLYSYDDKAGVSFSQERMADGLKQAVEDGIVDPQWAQSHQQQFQDVQDKYNALKNAAGSNSTLKAILHGGGIGAAFWAGSLPGAGWGAGAAGLIPVVGETGVAELVGGALGGLTTGTIAAWAAHKALDKLADYSEAVKSLNASAELHPMADAAGQLIGMSVNAPKALMNLTNAARIAAETGATVDAVKLVAKAAGAGAASGAAFEGVVRPLFDVAKNAVLDQLGIGHAAVQPPTVGSLITSAALGMITAGHDLRLKGYSAADIASIMSRAKIRTDAGIPLGADAAPAVAKTFQQLGIQIDEKHPMTRPLSQAEQVVYDALAKKAQQMQQEHAGSGAPDGGTGETTGSGAPQPSDTVTGHVAPPMNSRGVADAQTPTAITQEITNDVAHTEAPIVGTRAIPGLEETPIESLSPQHSESEFTNADGSGTLLDKKTADPWTAEPHQLKTPFALDQGIKQTGNDLLSDVFRKRDDALPSPAMAAVLHVPETGMVGAVTNVAEGSEGFEAKNGKSDAEPMGGRSAQTSTAKNHAFVGDGTPGADAPGTPKKAAGVWHPTFEPGPYADKSISARSSQRKFTEVERNAINQIGRETGCHSCGDKNPGTKSGKFVPDHQPVSALNTANVPQQLYPHCIACSRKQGLAVAHQLRKHKP